MTDRNVQTDLHAALRQLSVAQLRELRRRSARKRDTEFPALVPQERGETTPLSFSQERLWFLDQAGLVGSSYNLQTVLRLDGPLDIQALRRSLAELIRRHESLRTRFESREGSPVQIIDPSGACSLNMRDLSMLRTSEAAEQMRRFSLDEAGCPFDLERGSPFRVSLLKIGREHHALVMTIHHIVTDGWSLEILHREFGALYNAYSQGKMPELDDLPVQYADYAIWQRQWFQGDVLDAQLNYWREALADLPSELELPTDRPRRAVGSLRGERLVFHLPGSLLERIKALASREGGTLFMVLLAAYQVLLSRYCGQEDIVVGSPIAGRKSTQTESLIGFFVNTLILRGDLSGNPTFVQFLKQVRETTLGAYANQDLPFEKLVTDLRPERNLARQPLFQTVLALQNFPKEKLELAGLECTRVATGRAVALFDLSWYLFELHDGLRGELVFATDLFDRTTAQRLVGHFERLLEAIVDDPQCRVQELPLLTSEERRQILRDFNDTTAPFPRGRLVHELFEEQAERSRDAIAAIYESDVVSYAELNRRANRLAHHLLQQGVQVGQYVPVVMSRSLSMIVAQIAIMKCGGVYVPVDPALPDERREFVLKDCGASIVVRDCDASGHTELPDTNPKVQMTRLPPAYVMYTSGSTGIPKGVVVSHAAINRLIFNNRYAKFVAQDCVVHASNPSFDASTLEVWGALLNGGRVLIVSQAVLLEPDRFCRLLIEQQATVLWITVGLFAQYLETLAPAFRQLRYLMTGGDKVDAGLLRRVTKNSPPENLLCAYGPTECTTFSTTWLVPALGEEVESVPIGRPIGNTQVYILDKHLQPVPIGVGGEIYIGGPGVADGYLNRPELTAERFIPDPFAGDSSARLYKSGDLGRWRPDGVIDFLGRNDRQVKFRGFRIELGEIECQLSRHPAVKDVAVIAYEGSLKQKRLVAYVTARQHEQPAAADLREHLAALLPEYMVPTAFVVMKRLPLTVNGKLDQRALPLPDADAFDKPEYEAPQGSVEKALARIWQELLQVEPIGRSDSFFGLGGHSLLAIKALFRINQTFGCELRVLDVYQNPTIGELAGRISGGRAVDECVDLVREAVLDPSLRASTIVRHAAPQSVLLTGATGFVGRFLLAQLLEDTEATVFCLTRARSDTEATHRIEATLARWDLWKDEFRGRIVGVAGDLRAPRLGVDAVTFDALSEHVHDIYHCGTSMNHLETYAMARAANVASVYELLKLATSRETKLINYISTLSVFAPSPFGARRMVDELSSIDHERHLTGSGYAASKWVAEKMFASARMRGVPCNVFRLGFIWADAQLGRYDDQQRDYRVLKSSLMSGYGIKEHRYPLAPTPVDFAARAIVALGMRHREGRGTFHISSSEAGMTGVFERANATGATSLTLLPLYDWICEMKRLHRSGTSLPIVPLIEYAFAMDRERFMAHQDALRAGAARVECSSTHQELGLAGVDVPTPNDELIRLCVQGMYSRDPDLWAHVARRSYASEDCVH